MEEKILLGDEAVAQGAIDGGLAVAYSYPGTPASEIMEYLIKEAAKDKTFKASWSVNEKVAFEEALGVSFAGKRSLVSMKHVGLNVAADPFMNAAIVGIKGGLLVVVADDPGMHSSQNEQDSRYYAEFGNVICLEPGDHQEAYRMTRLGFEISERMNAPVMIRLVTRISHSRSRIRPEPRLKAPPLGYAKSSDWTLMPINARRLFKDLMERRPEYLKFSEESPFNSVILNQKNRSMGVIASGIAYNYVRENFSTKGDMPSILKIGTYPLPEKKIKQMIDHVDTLLVVEDGYPVIEKSIKGMFGIKDTSIRGKLSGDLPITGELSPEILRPALQLEPLASLQTKQHQLAGRPPQLCQGCPHIDTFNALNKAMADRAQAVVFSDIGCYTLSALPPLQAVDTCVCMGASVSMAKGGAEAGVTPSVGVIGDSTFAHSGMTPLLDAVHHNTDMTVIIVDNATVAMTGGQPTYATGDSLVNLVKGLGVDPEHVRSIQPLPKNLEANTKVIAEEIAHKGLSVIISSRECIHEARKRARRDRP
jgi:indolepyruvate ferredoxin oxidoreductase alpha subunit